MAGSKMPGKKRTAASRDPFASKMAPPLDETAVEKAVRLDAAVQAKAKSDAIDQALLRDAAARKLPKSSTLKIILLGQSGAGKTTVMKQMRLMYDQDAYEAERSSWRVVIYLNIIIAIRSLLDHLEILWRQSEKGGSKLTSKPANRSAQALLLLRMRLSPLLMLEASLKHILGAQEDPEPLPSKQQGAHSSVIYEDAYWDSRTGSDGATAQRHAHSASPEPRSSARFGHISLRGSPRKEGSSHPPSTIRKPPKGPSPLRTNASEEPDKSSSPPISSGLYTLASATTSDSSLNSFSGPLPQWRTSRRSSAQSFLSSVQDDGGAAWGDEVEQDEYIDAFATTPVSPPPRRVIEETLGKETDVFLASAASADHSAATASRSKAGKAGGVVRSRSTFEARQIKRSGQIGDDVVLRNGWQTRITGQKTKKASLAASTFQLFFNVLRPGSRGGPVSSFGTPAFGRPGTANTRPGSHAGPQRPGTANSYSSEAGWGKTVDWILGGKDMEEQARFARRNIDEVGSMLKMLCNDILDLWENKMDKEIGALMNYLRQCGFLDRLGTAPYFLDHLARISRSDYIPTDGDILRARARTVGVVEERLNAHGIVCNIFDVGGCRRQRAVWASFFDDAQAMIFVLPIGAFDQYLVEDPTVNCLVDSVLLFKQVVRHPLLAKVDFIVFMNKTDLLEQKLGAGVSFEKYHTRYDGSSESPAEVCRWTQVQLATIHEKYSPPEARNRAFYVHQSVATDTVHIRGIFENLFDVLMRNNMANIGLV